MTPSNFILLCSEEPRRQSDASSQGARSLALVGTSATTMLLTRATLRDDGQGTPYPPPALDTLNFRFTDLGKLDSA